MKNKKPELYFSIDIEADGPIPGQNSMLSLGCAAITREGNILDTWECNFLELPGAIQDPKTMEFWAKNPVAWENARKNPRDPNFICSFASWVSSYKDYKHVVVGYPIAYDFMFVYWYLIKFNKSSPFSHSGIDIKTLAMSKLNCPYKEASKKNMPKEWFYGAKHTHVAVDDAIEQARLFINILNSK